MAEAQTDQVRRVVFSVVPFDSPSASDYYANLTGVGSTPLEIVLAFAQTLPGAQVAEDGTLQVAPRVRVTLTLAAAQRLHEQLAQQLEQMAAIQEEIRRREESGVR